MCTKIEIKCLHGIKETDIEEIILCNDQQQELIPEELEDIIELPDELMVIVEDQDENSQAKFLNQII